MQRFHPKARDAGLARVSRITVAVVAASSAATLGLGAAIATAAPPPKAAKQKADFNADKSKPARLPTRVRLPGAGQPGQPSQSGQSDQSGQSGQSGQAQQAQPQLQPPAERPESSSGDEQTTSGGS